MSDTQTSSYPNVVYLLDVRAPETPSHRIAVHDFLTIGSAEESEVCLEDFKLAPKHCVFRVHNEILSVHNLGGDSATQIGKVELKQGKMYILDKGDKVSLGEIEIFIRREDINSKESYQKLLKEFSPSGDDKEEVQEILNKEDKTQPGKAKNKINKNKLVTSSKKSQASLRPPGFLVRLYATLVNLSLGYAIYYFLLPLLGLENIFTRQIESLYTLISPYTLDLLSPIQVKQIIIHFILFWVMEIIGHLIFALPIPYFLLGIFHQGSIMGQRIKGLLRLAFSLLTTPFLIFDLPVLIGKRPLKESLSGTSYRYGSNFIKYLGLIIIFPLIICLSLLSPLLNYPNDFNGVTLSKISPARIKKKDKDLPLLETQSAFLNLNIKAPKPKLFILPELSIKKIRGNKKKKIKSSQVIQKGLRFVHQTKDQSVAFVVKDEINYKTLLEKSEMGNPLFPVFFNMLSDEQNLQKKIKRLLQDSLVLGIPTFQDILIRNGPFLNGLLSLRSYLFKRFAIDINTSSNWLSTAGGEFLFFNNIKNKKEGLNYILHLKDRSISVIQVRYKTKERSLSHYLKNKILPYSLPFRAKKKGAEISWNAFVIIDFIKKLEGKRKVPKDQYDKAYDYIFQESANLMNHTNRNAISYQTQSIKQMIDSLALINKKKKDPKITALKSKLDKVYKALKRNDANFFKADETPAPEEASEDNKEPGSL